MPVKEGEGIVSSGSLDLQTVAVQSTFPELHDDCTVLAEYINLRDSG